LLVRRLGPRSAIEVRSVEPAIAVCGSASESYSANIKFQSLVACRWLSSAGSAGSIRGQAENSGAIFAKPGAFAERPPGENLRSIQPAACSGVIVKTTAPPDVPVGLMPPVKTSWGLTGSEELQNPASTRACQGPGMAPRPARRASATISSTSSRL
jgi:hypothetical protein